MSEAGMAAREAALQMLYALELGGQDAKQIERWYIEAHPLAPGVRERAGALLDMAVAEGEQIEGLIRRNARGWKLERISVIDRSLLKLATAELLLARGGGPGHISLANLNHALLRLGRKYSQPETANFLHGLLDAIARELEGQAHAASAR